jgi:hypothetical protein
MTAIEIGKLLRAGTTGCVVGCRVNQIDVPSFGCMVRIPLENDGGYEIFGLVYDIHVDDDGLVRQLVTAGNVPDNIIQDNRVNRNVPVEISVLFTGYREKGQVFHLLPPRPPLTLDAIYLCEIPDLCEFTSAGRFGYLRHVLRAGDLPVGELLATHLMATAAIQSQNGSPDWAGKATQELITLLRDDYSTLMSVLSALGDARIAFLRVTP